MTNQMTKSAKDVNAILDAMMKKIGHLEDKVECLESRTMNYEKQIDMLTKELKRTSKDDKNYDKVGTIKCKECDLIFKNVTVLKEHIRGKHPKIYNCKNCEQSFDSWSKLENHLLNDHDKLKEFECSHCKKIFVT